MIPRRFYPKPTHQWTLGGAIWAGHGNAKTCSACHGSRLMADPAHPGWQTRCSHCSGSGTEPTAPKATPDRTGSTPQGDLDANGMK